MEDYYISLKEEGREVTIENIYEIVKEEGRFVLEMTSVGERYKIKREGELYSLFEGRIEPDVLYFHGRLMSTAGGCWWWEASDNFREKHLSRAPYRPYVNVLFFEPTIIIEPKKKYEEEEEIPYPKYESLQVIMADDYWILTILCSNDKIISERELRVELFSEVMREIEIDEDRKKDEMSVGNLNICLYEISTEKYKRAVEILGSVKYVQGLKFYNHYIDAESVIRLDNVMLVFPMYEKKKYVVRIVSPSHITEDNGFLTLKGSEEYVLYLRHPLPEEAD